MVVADLGVFGVYFWGHGDESITACAASPFPNCGAGYVTGSVNQELLLQNEYLAAENRILKDGALPSRLRLSYPERTTLAEIVP